MDRKVTDFGAKVVIFMCLFIYLDA